MNISTIQKRKLLNNIYKLYYSSGTKPTEGEIRNIFNQYFYVNKIGVPLNVDYGLLQSVNITDVNILNELMGNSLFNLEVLYESIIENNQELFFVINTLNNKLENLKNKRKELEGKVDQLIFSNNNSDGYFYSYLENFSNLSKIDMSLTSAYIDIENGNCRIPKITSSISNLLTVDNLAASGVTYNVSVNGTQVIANTIANNFDAVFDGLNDTYWSYEYLTVSPAIVSLTINIPVTASFNISKVNGSILTSSPLSTEIKFQATNSTVPDEILYKDSKSDYNRFYCSIPARQYSNISITFSKSEPDRVMSNSVNPYVYSFGLRELIVAAEYHDKYATVVSTPISIPEVQNQNLLIGSVSLEVDSQLVDGTNIKYYVCDSSSNSTSLTDYNWIPIEPINYNQSSFEKIINLLGSNKRIKYIDSTNADYSLIQLNDSSTNINELNPTKLPNSNVEVYRTCAVDQSEIYIDPFLLANINCIKLYNTININSTENTSSNQLYKNLDLWNSKIKDKNTNEIYESILTNQFNQISPKINAPSNGFMTFSVYIDKASKVSHTISKSRDDFNLAIYLNNNLIADLPSGKSNSIAEWNFVQGINNIVITYDKSFSGLIDLNIMSSARIIDYGTMFLDYYSYLDPIEFRRRADLSKRVFTIDKFYNRKELITSNKISSRSMIQYYAKESNNVTSIRYRADLERYENPLHTPVIDSIRIKFKHVDI